MRTSFFDWVEDTSRQSCWARISTFRILKYKYILLTLNNTYSGMIFGEGQHDQISDGPSESPPNFEKLVLGCVDANFIK